MPRTARPLSPYSFADPGGKSAGQRRGIFRCDGRTKFGRQLKASRAALLEHLGPDATIPQLALAEQIAILELRASIFNNKFIQGRWTKLDNDTFLALINSIKRLYQALGLERPAPKFSELLRDKKDA